MKFLSMCDREKAKLARIEKKQSDFKVKAFKAVLKGLRCLEDIGFTIRFNGAIFTMDLADDFKPQHWSASVSVGMVGDAHFVRTPRGDCVQVELEMQNLERHTMRATPFWLPGEIKKQLSQLCAVKGLV